MDSQVTLCKYPFVFDAPAKTTLLQTDAVIQMQVRLCETVCVCVRRFYLSKLTSRHVCAQMAVDQAQRQNFTSLFLSGGGVESVNPCLILIVRRENVVGDTMEVLRKSKNVDYKKPLKV